MKIFGGVSVGTKVLKFKISIDYFTLHITVGGLFYNTERGVVV